MKWSYAMYMVTSSTTACTITLKDKIRVILVLFYDVLCSTSCLLFRNLTHRAVRWFVFLSSVAFGSSCCDSAMEGHDDQHSCKQQRSPCRHGHPTAFVSRGLKLPKESICMSGTELTETGGMRALTAC